LFALGVTVPRRRKLFSTRARIVWAYELLSVLPSVLTARAEERAAQQDFAAPRSCHQAVAFLQFHAMPAVGTAVSE
jgi:hypothetical protein